MATELKLRGGTTAQHATFTGAAREVTVDTDKNTIIVHDGSTAGGHETALVANTIEKTADTGSAVLPSGDDSERDASPSAGYIRWNTDGTELEVYDGSNWSAVGGGGGASGLADGDATTPAVNFSADTNTGVYRPGADRLGFAAGGALVGEFDGTNLKFNSGYGSVATAYGCRAWVNFNGTGTVAIRESGNVSSITDNGTGNYTVNFTNAMTDANYAPVVSGSSNLSSYSMSLGVASQTSSGFVIDNYNDSLGARDAPIVVASVFR